MKPFPPIGQEDLDMLGGLLSRELEGLIAFASATLYPGRNHDEGLPPVTVPERQRQRIKGALCKGEPFWDRISDKVFLPLGDGAGRLGTLVLEGVTRSVGPEEAMRWLPVLQKCANQALSLLWHKVLWLPRGGLPRILSEKPQGLHGMEHDDEARTFLHLLFRTSIDPDSTVPQLSRLCEGLFAGTRPRFLGMNAREVWLELPGGDTDLLRRKFKEIVPATRLKRIPLWKAFLHQMKRGSSPRRLEEAASLLGSSVMCTADLADLQERLGTHDLPRALAKTMEMLSGRGAETSTVVFLNRVANLEVPGEVAQGNPVELVMAGEGAGFVIVRQAGGPDEALRIAEDLCTDAAAACMGAASCREPTTRGYKAAAASLWAYLHARLLGPGSRVAFEPLSWNVAGDELLSWGDLPGAVRAYRLGLEMDGTDANLWNSLGVCLGQLHRSSEAGKAFGRAVALRPDHYMAHYNLGGVHEDQGRMEEAAMCFRRALECRPGDLTVATRLARALLKLGRPAEAAEVLEPMIKKDGVGMGAPLRTMAQALVELGDWARAKVHLERALRVNPSDKKALALLARGYLEKEGDRETARRLAGSMPRGAKHHLG